MARSFSWTPVAEVFGAAWDAAEDQGPWAPEQQSLHIAWLALSAVLRAPGVLRPAARGQTRPGPL
jgi:hypothetical protein